MIQMSRYEPTLLDLRIVTGYVPSHALFSCSVFRPGRCPVSNR